MIILICYKLFCHNYKLHIGLNWEKKLNADDYHSRVFKAVNLHHMRLQVLILE